MIFQETYLNKKKQKLSKNIKKLDYKYAGKVIDTINKIKKYKLRPSMVSTKKDIGTSFYVTSRIETELADIQQNKEKFFTNREYLREQLKKNIRHRKHLTYRRF